MKLHILTSGAALLGATAISAAKNGLPVDKVYGVNLGSWLLSEPWQFPKEWQAMGGEICDDDCSRCAAHEFGLVQKLGQDAADKVFEKHWSTWFTQDSVNEIADAGLNTVRIPLGYWIVESLVDRNTEFYPRGGMKWLKKGLRMLKEKGIHVILDHHALPGVASPNQMFAGRCTSDAQFYKTENYNRALTWAAVMTALSHMDPDFSTVFSIQAINEPIMDANNTPGYGDYQKNFVKVVRMVELALGVRCPDTDYTKLFSNTNSTSSIDNGLLAVAKEADPILAAVLKSTAECLPGIAFQLGLSSTHLRRAIGDDAIAVDSHPEKVKEGHGAGRSSGFMGSNGPVNVKPVKRSNELEIEIEAEVPHGSSLERHNDRRRRHHARGVSATLSKGAKKECLMTSFMNKGWQYNNPPNPADAAIGPQLYDAHLYFSFGGVADPNAESYMKVICNTDRVRVATEDGNRPLVFGEWSLATNFAHTPEFLYDWADAQRHIYAGQADGWIFWSFKIEEGSPNIPYWSYFESLKAGYFTKDPSKLKNPDICKPWIANGTATA